MESEDLCSVIVSEDLRSVNVSGNYIWFLNKHSLG